jgi:probable addiction module antidote protein
MKLKTKNYDVANYLDSDEIVAIHLDAAFETGNLARIAEALGDVARARGMSKIAKATGLAREQLYKTLSAEGKPELSTVLKVMSALGGGLKSNFSARIKAAGEGRHTAITPRRTKAQRAA